MSAPPPHRLAALVIAGALAVSAAPAPTARAEASSSSVASLTGYVACDFGTHRTSASASILLDQIWHDSYLTGTFSTVEPFTTGDTWLNARGAFRVGVQVGVWNGSAYEYATTRADSYTVSRNGYRVAPSSGTYCRG